ncbi:protein translocase subunit SecF [Candidatus Woesearchaeota archaeon]|nr:protein translocase subunit SecF [Candidatus Woesearchaeota archaeon]
MKLEGLKTFYEDKYKNLMIISFVILFIALGVLGFWKVSTGEFIAKDTTLKGGLLITVQTNADLDISQIEGELKDKLGVDISVRKLQAMGTSGSVGYAFELEQKDIDEVKSAISEVTGIELVSGKYTVEEMSSALGSSFWSSTLKALGLAFLFMSLVVLYYFRVPIPSGAIVLCAVSDLVATLATMNLIGFKLSTAGVAALLMLLGYSVDTDILLSTKLLKRKEGTIMERVYSAMKTGVTMELTTIIALTVLWIVSPALVLRQIAAILIIGLLFDLLFTWIQNTGILRWYLEKKGVKDEY